MEEEYSTPVYRCDECGNDFPAEEFMFEGGICFPCGHKRNNRGICEEG